MAKNRYPQLGSVLRDKENPKEFYIKLSADLLVSVKDKDGDVIDSFELKAGDCLNLETPQSYVAFLVKNGHITDKQGEERLGKIPDYVKYNIKAKIANTDEAAPARQAKQDNDF